MHRFLEPYPLPQNQVGGIPDQEKDWRALVLRVLKGARNCNETPIAAIRFVDNVFANMDGYRYQLVPIDDPSDDEEGSEETVGEE